MCECECVGARYGWVHACGGCARVCGGCTRVGGVGARGCVSECVCVSECTCVRVWEVGCACVGGGLRVCGCARVREGGLRACVGGRAGIRACVGGCVREISTGRPQEL